MENPERLEVYRLARLYSQSVHRATRAFPRYQYRLKAQLDDAAESIGSNIAERCARKNSEQSNAELIRFLHIALSSQVEAQHRVNGSHDKDLIREDVYADLDEQAERLKAKLIRLVMHLQRNDRGRRGKGKGKGRG